MNRFLRSAFFPLIVIVVLVWLASQTLIHTGGTAEKRTTSQAIADVQQGLVSSAEFNPSKRAITATEVDPDRLALLRARFADDPRVDVRALDVFAPEPADHSAFVAFNVLEHIPDHVGALRAAHTLLRPGSAVVMFVPAFEFAMSGFDRAVGHVRRYTTASLTRAFRDADLEVEKVRYVNMPGLPAWFVGMRLLRMTPGEGRLLDVWDAQVVPRARRWESRHRAPFGQSVFGVARTARR